MRGKHRRTTKVVLLIFFLVWLVLIARAYFYSHPVSVLAPAGAVAQKERNLLLFALGLCAIVVVPVFVLAIYIPLRYRAGRKNKTRYQPNWDGSRWIEGAWWAVPLAIITTLAVVAWNSSYSLDPYKALAVAQKPVNVQVVALDWKWLFIYPDQKIATVNYLELPVNRPVNFRITSDSVMNSFWIPSLGGQIYAMPGMDTQLHLIASKTDSYRGTSANISGRGFASMAFKVRVASKADFDDWTNSVRSSSNQLTRSSYQSLALPSQNDPVRVYSLADRLLYDEVLASYSGPGGMAHGGHL